MTRIPRVVHYVFGMAPDFGGKPWGLVHHACLMSAIRHIKPDKVMFHYGFEPQGPWWDLSRPHVTLVHRPPPTEIYGQMLLHVAHRADVVRLQTLIEHGGIYMDADVLVQRDFDDLLDFSTVLGREGEQGEYGTANAIILAERASPFLQRWLDEYRWFRSKGRDEYWAEHSVELPARLASEHPDEIHILPYTAFFWPLWTDQHIDWIFNSTTPIPPGGYANHLWEAKAWAYFEHLTPGQVRRRDTNFHRWLRPYVSELPDSYGLSLAVRAQKLYRSARHIAGKARTKLMAAAPGRPSLEPPA